MTAAWRVATGVTRGPESTYAQDSAALTSMAPIESRQDLGCRSITTPRGPGLRKPLPTPVGVSCHQ